MVVNVASFPSLPSITTTITLFIVSGCEARSN
jgi:hypothetical protein